MRYQNKYANKQTKSNRISYDEIAHTHNFHVFQSANIISSFYINKHHVNSITKSITIYRLSDFQRALIMPIVTRKLTPRRNLPSNF